MRCGSAWTHEDLFHLLCVNDHYQRYVAVSRERVEFVNRRASASN